MSERPEWVWVFNINRRVYPAPEPGSLWSSGGPIWREHWEKHKITGETSKSWVTELREKVPKHGADPRVYAFSEDAITRQAYIQDHRAKIADALRKCDDYDALVKIADMLGYRPAIVRPAK